MKRIIEYLRQRKVGSIEEISKATGLPKEDVKRMVEEMEKEGLVRVLEAIGPASVVLTVKGENSRM